MKNENIHLHPVSPAMAGRRIIVEFPAEEKIKRQEEELQRAQAAIRRGEQRVEALQREVNELRRLAGRPGRHASPLASDEAPAAEPQTSGTRSAA